MAKPGRNDPCPCGSGQKYKKCCLSSETSSGVHPAHDRHAALLHRALRWALQRYGADWHRKSLASLNGGRPPGDEALHWFEMFLICYMALPGQENTAFDEFLQHNPPVNSAERDLVEAQRQARFSVFCLLGGDGRHVDLEDAFTSERFRVRDGSLGKARPNSYMLAQLVFIDDTWLCFEAFPQALPPAQAEAVVRRLQYLVGAAPPERYREPVTALLFHEMWRDAVRDLVENPYPEMRNAQGHDVCIVTDRYVCDLSQVELLGRMAELSGFEAQDEKSGILLDGSRVVAFWRIEKGVLIVENNSNENADSVQAQLEALQLPGFRRKRRNRVSQAQLKDKKPAPAQPTPPDLADVMRGLRRKFDAEWLDASVPALAGKTPREAVSTAEGRRSVEALLREFEYRGSNMPQEQRSDIAWMRSELGLLA